MDGFGPTNFIGLRCLRKTHEKELDNMLMASTMLNDKRNKTPIFFKKHWSFKSLLSITGGGGMIAQKRSIKFQGIFKMIIYH